MADNKKSKLFLSQEHRERLTKIIPIALELMAQNGPDDVFDKVKSMPPEDAYIVGMVVGRNLHVIGNSMFLIENKKKK